MSGPGRGSAGPVTREDGTRLHVLDSGGTGPALLLLHGLAGYAGEWAQVAERLAGACRVVAFDQRAHGSSTRRPADLSRTAHVGDVVAVADALGLERFTLVGQSMGAHTALLAAAAHPARVGRLVLIEGGVGGEGPEATADVIDWFRAWPIPFATVDDAVAHLGGGPAARVWAEGLEETDAGWVPRFDVDVLEAALRPVHERPRWEEWGQIAAPTLLITGENGYVPAGELDDMRRRRPDVRHVQVPGAGHDVHLDAPERVAELVRGFAS
ncbi:alpha/beta fold hydrolase [Micrococcus luteus]|uniref:alpha/beta fold hydrolase n=1 Tax=Micrococcus luteus TaxID=1270 RepID=UPI0037C7D6A9